MFELEQGAKRTDNGYEARVHLRDRDDLGEQLRPCQFRGSDKLRRQLGEALNDEVDELTIFNVSERHVGLDDTPDGFDAVFAWTVVERDWDQW